MRFSLLLPTLLISAALAGGFALTYSGPYQWASEAQRAVFSTHWIQVSFLAAWVVVGRPMYGLAMALDRRLGPEPASDARFEALFDFMTGGTHGTLFLGGLATTAVAGWLSWQDANAGPLTMLDLAVLEAGGEPPSHYVDLTGFTPQMDAAVLYQGKNYDRTFVPLHAGNGPAVVFAKVPENDVITDPLRGQLEEAGLPGEVRTHFENAGLIGDHHYTLYVNRDPAEAAQFGVYLLIGGIAAMIAGLGWGRWRLRQLMGSELHTP